MEVLCEGLLREREDVALVLRRLCDPIPLPSITASRVVASFLSLPCLVTARTDPSLTLLPCRSPLVLFSFRTYYT